MHLLNYFHRLQPVIKQIRPFFYREVILFHSKTVASLPENVHEKLGAALVCKKYEREQDTREIPWQAFNVSRYRADVQFANIENDLSLYRIMENDSPVKVETPSGNEFSCWQYYMD